MPNILQVKGQGKTLSRVLRYFAMAWWLSVVGLYAKLMASIVPFYFLLLPIYQTPTRAGIVFLPSAGGENGTVCVRIGGTPRLVVFLLVAETKVKREPKKARN